MIKRLLLVLLVLLPPIAAAFLLEDFVRDTIVIPVLYTFWYLRLLFESIPQVVLWFLLIGLVLFFGARSLTSRRSLPSVPQATAHQRGRVEEWARMLVLAERRGYSRWRLAHRLGRLAIEVLAHQYKLGPRQARQMLDSDAASLPPEVRAYLRSGTGIYHPEVWMRRPFRFNTSSPLDLDPEQVLRHLEERVHVQMGDTP